MKTGIELIAEERQEQITKHGRAIDKDIEQNHEGQLITGAIAIIKADDSEMPADWNDLILNQKMVDKPYKERLVIAGALIAAEIDRINALNQTNHE